MDFDSARPVLLVSVVDISMYSVSLTPKFPLTPSRCLSSTLCTNVLVQDIFSLVISVINLTLASLSFASKIAFFITSNAEDINANDLESAK